MQMFDNWVLTPKNGLHRWSQRYSFGLHRSGTFWVASWSTSYDLRWWSCGTSNIFILSQNDIFDHWSSSFSKVFAMNKKSTYLRCLQKPFFFPRGGLFRLVKKTPRKTCGWFFGDISDGGLLVSPDGWWNCCWYDATYSYCFSQLGNYVKCLNRSEPISLVNLRFFIIKRLVIPNDALLFKISMEANSGDKQGRPLLKGWHDVTVALE